MSRFSPLHEIAGAARPGSPFVVRITRAAEPALGQPQGQRLLQRKEEKCLT